MVVVKYLTISQYDDSYTTFDKMRHLLVHHYVKNDVEFLDVPLCIKMQVQKNYSLQQIMSFESDTKMIIFFSTTFIIT
jgi:hypothetical protein